MIPALNEAEAIGDVVRGIARFVDEVIVADNGSTDETAAVARAAGARVVLEPQRGYGAACLRGLAAASAADIVLMLDADGSDDPDDAPLLLAPVLSGEVDFALGARDPARTERGAMTPVQRFGNWLAPALMRLRVGTTYTDMPPFKAITRQALSRLALDDRGYGFTIQLLLRAHAHGLRVQEVPVRCRRRRGGESKVSGTLSGTLRASARILYSIARHSQRPTLEVSP